MEMGNCEDIFPVPETPNILFINPKILLIRLKSQNIQNSNF